MYVCDSVCQYVHSRYNKLAYTFARTNRSTILHSMSRDKYVLRQTRTGSNTTRSKTKSENKNYWKCPQIILIQYCPSHNYWGPHNSFQQLLVPVYYRKTVGETWNWSSIIMRMAVRFCRRSSNVKKNKKTTKIIENAARSY